MRKGIYVVATIAIVGLSSLAACSLSNSLAGYSDGDAGPSATMFAVGGTIEGLEGSSATLVLNGDRSIIAGDGAFAFQDALADGADYAVTVLENPSGHVCTIERAVGRIARANVADIAVHCPSTDASLTSLTVSGASLSPAFDPTKLAYAAGPLTVPTLFSLGEASITATSPHAGVQITIAGKPASSGVAKNIAVATGPNAIDVDVVAADGKTRQTYSIALSGQVSTYVKASNTRPTAFFGQVVAASGDTIAIGAPSETSNATGVGGNAADTSMSGAGAVYVFRHAATGWVQEAYVKASNTRANAMFGTSLALSGNTLVVGASGESSNATGVGGDQANTGAPSAGAVYVFARTGTTWSQQAYIKASNTRSYARFGTSVAIAQDTLVVGSDGETSNATNVGGNPNDTTLTNAGAAYVFARSGTIWSQQAYVKASNTRAFADFGRTVAVSGDTLAVGAPGESSNATGIGGDQANTTASSSGAVYVYVRAGTTWSPQAYVKAPNTRQNAVFGSAIALSNNTLAVGSPFETSNATGIDANQNDTSASGAGAAYVFVRAGTAWSQQAYVKASNTRANATFGTSVAIFNDSLVVGSPGEASAAIGIDGNQSDTTAPNAGAAYVFVRTGTTWMQRAYVKASNTRASTQFGVGVGIADGTLVVGANKEESYATGIDGNQTNTSMPNAGAAYVFK